MFDAFASLDFVAQQFGMHVVHILPQFGKDLDNRLVRSPGRKASQILKNVQAAPSDWGR